jgi:protein-tyrosine phosphatase
MTEILPGLLYLGSVNSVNKQWLVEKNIQSILNCAIEIDDKVDVEYMKLNLDDYNENNNFINEYPRAMEFINHSILNRKPILVHCRMGINRSTTITILYLAKYCGMTINQAYAYVKLKRIFINPVLMNKI